MASQHRLNALFDLSRALSSSLDLEQVLRQFTLHAQDLIGASASAVSAWDRDRDVLLMLADYGNTVVADIAEVREELSLAELPATRRVLQAQRPETVHVSNLADDATERALLERHGYRSLLMLPMVSRGETIGLMEIVDVDERRWDAADLEFCQSLCDVVAAAVHNAMLNQQQRAAEQRYRALVENLPAITYIDQAGSGQPLYTSPQIAELMGVPVEEWLASPDGWAQRIHPEDREAATAAYDETVRSGRPYHHVYRVIDLHGQVRWFRDDAVALRDSQGVPTLIQGVLFDITREKHAEAALSASELRFRTLVEHVPVAIYVDALSGATIYNSPHNAVITGYGDEQWLAEPDLFSRIIHPDDRDRVLAGFEGLRATGRPFWADYRIVRPDGEVRWVHDEAVLVRDAEGVPVHVQGYLLDITERRHAEDALRVSQQRFREMLENVRLAAVTCATDGRITFCNEYLAELSGWSRDELLGRSWIDVFTPAEEEELEMRARTAMQSGGVIAHYESTLVTREGERRLFSWNNTLLRDAEGRVLGSASIGEDITDRRRTEQELQRLAYHDALTGLPNRILFREHLDVALARAERTGRGVAVLYVDLDDFKLVNDSFGHSAGDELLCEVARRLRTATRSSDVVARQGGDEFLILVADVEVGDGEAELDIDEIARRVADQVRRALQRSMTVAGTEIYTSASVGISLHPLDAPDSESLLKHADIAMYKAKESGRDGYQLYAVDGNDPRAQLSMAGRLRRAVERSELLLHYQPLVALETGAVVGAEALIRWRDSERGLVMPGQFIPLAERTGLIGPISEWVIEEACRQSAEWRARGLDLYVSVNLPAVFWKPTAMRQVLATIERFGLSADRMMVEITESTVMADTLRSEPIIAELHERGLRLAIDDFGTGHSSLSRLNQMLVTTLKIDRSFVCDLPDDESAAVLVATIIQLATNLGLHPLAEGIETEQQRRFLVEHGCALGQGFLFSPPVAAEEIERVYWAGRKAA